MNHFEIIQKLEQSGLSIYGKNEKLNELLQNYPSFSGGHLLKAVQGQNSRDAESLKQKALLYGGENPWLQFIIQQLNDSITGTLEWPSSENENTILDPNNSMYDSELSNSGNEKIQDEQDLQDAALDAETLLEAAIQAEEIPGETENEQKDATSLENNRLSAGSSEETKASSPNEESILIEPYYTVDYFASQGIRLKEDKLGNDPLSKQVKTFTQWLRSMKKICTEEQTTIGEKDEENVVQIADSSNREEIVLTETMAQVLIQQGKKTKAIEVYRKLSLLHPEKSSYFATLIEHLKDAK
jgi:hypothetical protein